MGNDVLVFQTRPGPGHVWIAECSPLTLFMLFWDDELFEVIKNMTNKNALLKRHANPEKHKAKVREISVVEEMKTFFWSLYSYGYLKTT